MDQISRRPRLDRRFNSQSLAKLRDLPLHLSDGRDRRSASIEIVRESVDGDDPVRVQEQDRKSRALLASTEWHGDVVVEHLERPQDSKVEHLRPDASRWKVPEDETQARIVRQYSTLSSGLRRNIGSRRPSTRARLDPRSSSTNPVLGLPRSPKLCSPGPPKAGLGARQRFPARWRRPDPPPPQDTRSATGSTEAAIEELNQALHQILVTRLQIYPATIAYTQERPVWLGLGGALLLGAKGSSGAPDRRESGRVELIESASAGADDNVIEDGGDDLLLAS